MWSRPVCHPPRGARDPVWQFVLNSVEVGCVHWVPLGPDVGIFSQCAITSAGNITEDSVKLEMSNSCWVGGGDEHVRKSGGIVVHHHKCWGLQSLSLMREHVASGIVGIIGDKETSRQGSRWHLVQSLNKLGGFASGSGAHVEHLVVRLHSQHEGRQH